MRMTRLRHYVYTQKLSRAKAQAKHGDAWPQCQHSHGAFGLARDSRSKSD